MVQRDGTVLGEGVVDAHRQVPGQHLPLAGCLAVKEDVALAASAAGKDQGVEFGEVRQAGLKQPSLRRTTGQTPGRRFTVLMQNIELDLGPRNVPNYELMDLP